MPHTPSNCAIPHTWQCGGVLEGGHQEQQPLQVSNAKSEISSRCKVKALRVAVSHWIHWDAGVECLCIHLSRWWPGCRRGRHRQFTCIGSLSL